MSKKLRVLVVEDHHQQRKVICQILDNEGYRVIGVESAELALEKLAAQPVDLVLSDWKLPGIDGIQLLEICKAQYPEILFVMATAYGSINHAVDAVRKGAEDYLTKPYQKDQLLVTLEKASRTLVLRHENRQLQQEVSKRERLVNMVGSSKSMQLVYKRLEKVADTRATVLISGESGTGKELAARALHTLSERKNKPFIAVNCAAIPESIAEAELFGAEKGAFTGVDKLRLGKFEAADGGTLFLDEIGELPLALQSKLLRLLQEGVVTRLGSNKEKTVDVRLVAATNRDLSQEVKEGRFREDLYYRLNVVPLVMPPLRERREDIPDLVSFFAESASEKHGIDRVVFSKAALGRLIDFPWIGNVRELANTVERLVLLADDSCVGEGDLDFVDAAQPNGHAFRLPAAGIDWEVHEKSCLQQALELASGNRSQAARYLNLNYKAFLYRLDKHQL